MTLPSYPDAARLDLTETLHGRAGLRPLPLAGGSGQPADQGVAAAPGGAVRELPGRAARPGASWPPDCRTARRRRGRHTHLARRAAVLHPARGRPGARGALHGLRRRGRASADRPDPIDPSGLTTLDSWQPDHEGRLLAYQLSEGGSEESVLRVMDVADRRRTWTARSTDAATQRSRGCRAARPSTTAAGSPRTPSRPVRTSSTAGSTCTGSARRPARTSLILGDGMDKTNYYGVSVSRDGRWLVITASAGTAPRNDVWIADLSARPVQRTEPAGHAAGRRCQRPGRSLAGTAGSTC